MLLSIPRRLLVGILGTSLFAAGGALCAPQADAALPPAPVAAESRTKDDLNDLADKVIEVGIPGVVLGTRTDGKAMSVGRGVADIDTKRPARPDDRYRVGSTTKTMTAVVALQLVEEGKLRLDDPVDRWLPQFDLDKRMTVRHLLQQTSGFHTDTRILTPPRTYESNRFHHFTPTELVRIALTNPEPRPAPGTHWEYANTNYILAGMVIEKVTGRPMGVELNRRIFTPLGLKDTAYPVVSPFVPGRHLKGYLSDGPGKPLVDTTVYTMSWARSAGAVVSTTGDATTFLRALFTGRLLSKPMLAEMKDMDKWGYGLGLYGFELPCAPGGMVWGHNGKVYGYHSVVFTTADGSRQAAIGANAWIFDEELGDLNPITEQAAIVALCDDPSPAKLAGAKRPAPATP